MVMAEKEKTYMPQSSAGIMRYMDVEDHIKIKPSHVVILSVAFGTVIMLLKFFA